VNQNLLKASRSSDVRGPGEVSRSVNFFSRNLRAGIRHRVIDD